MIKLETINKLNQTDSLEKLIRARQIDSDNLNMILMNFCDMPGHAETVFDTLDVAESTSIQYKKCIGRFLDYVRSENINLDVFLNYKKHLSSRKDIKVATKNVYLSSASVFLKELSRQGFIKDVTLNVKHFSQTKKHKRFGHNREQIRSLYNKINNLPDSPKNSRMAAIFHLAAIQGLREVEISRIDVEDIHPAGGILMIQGKGKDDKEPIYLADLTKMSLEKHIAYNNLKSGPLFFSLSRRTLGGRITTRTIRYLYDEFKKGMDIDASMHGFRHFFTTELIRKGLPLNKVQLLTRHKSLSMLQVYNDEVIDKNDSKAIYDDFVSELLYD